MLQLFLTHLQGYKRQAVWSPILIVVEVICELLLPLVMAEIVDTAIPAGDETYIFQLGAVMLVLAGVVDAAGGKLAQPEYQGPENDMWIGCFLAWEYFPGEGEVIRQDRTNWVEYGSQKLDVSGLGSVSIPREILIGQYQEGKGFTFPGLGDTAPFWPR